MVVTGGGIYTAHKTIGSKVFAVRTFIVGITDMLK